MRDILTDAEAVVASELTWLEIARVLARGADTALLDRLFRRLSADWRMVPLAAPGSTTRIRVPFPVEPVGTLDALHLSAAGFVREYQPSLAVLTLDLQVRANVLAFGWPLLPV